METSGVSQQMACGDSCDVAGNCGRTEDGKIEGQRPGHSRAWQVLDEHRLAAGNPSSGIMFVTRNNTPLSMNNLLNDQIAEPALDCCACGWRRSSTGHRSRLRP